MPLRTISKKSHYDPAATLNRLADRVKYASTAQCVTIVQDGLLWKWPLRVSPRAWRRATVLASLIGEAPLGATGEVVNSALCVALHLVRFWHKADIPMLSANVRFRG
jgi:hypothetical protein